MNWTLPEIWKFVDEARHFNRKHPTSIQCDQHFEELAAQLEGQQLKGTARVSNVITYDAKNNIIIHLFCDQRGKLVKSIGDPETQWMSISIIVPPEHRTQAAILNRNDTV